MKRSMAVILSVVLISASLAGCGGKNASSNGGGAEASAVSSKENELSKIVSIALSENILNLDPLNQNCVPGDALADMVFDGLVEDDHQGGFKPRLAKTWDVSDDGLTYTFYLREGVKASNGEAMNADDVVMTYQRLLDESTLVCAANYWSDLESVEKKDDLTVAIHLKQPNGACLQGVSSARIIPNEAFKEHGEKLFTEQIMTGSGPWIFDKWVDGQYVHLIKNTEYWNPDVDSYYDEVYLRFVMEPSTAISGQISGEVNAYITTSGISPDMLGLYQGSEDKCDLVTVDTSTIDYLGFNCNPGSPFADADVRKAFSMSIDRQTIVDTIMGGGIVPVGIMNSASLGYDEALTSENYSYNPEMAKTLLDNSSYGGEPIKISCTSSFQSLALAVSDYANTIGFHTTVDIVESATLADIRATGSYDAFIVTAMLASGDPYQFCGYRIHADAHNSGYKNEKLNELILQAAANSDMEQRDALYQQANKILADECAPMVSLLQLQCIQSINYGITGIRLYPDGFFNFTYIDYDSSLVK